MSSSPPPSNMFQNVKVQVRHRMSQGHSSQRPNSTRAAGAGGSSSTMLRLYTDDAPGLTILGFIGSIQSGILRHSASQSSTFFLHPVSSPHYHDPSPILLLRRPMTLN
ncbi:hypothetical protein MERGE_002389 [Pneumocystis wakefieldiae]|uniref:Uncharacterized protein n=1 Tax=Pneumocystis wakefieldiae TaxID=38082 RepID=A0A899FXR1_9ASCO|nr:hypothetical protein MERGE_002389 [Pneumocystis wakefieldiae]